MVYWWVADLRRRRGVALRPLPLRPLRSSADSRLNGLRSYARAANSCRARAALSLPETRVRGATIFCRRVWLLHRGPCATIPFCRQPFSNCPPPLLREIVFWQIFLPEPMARWRSRNKTVLLKRKAIGAADYDYWYFYVRWRNKPRAL
jgi:hypothetical protein